MHFPNHDLKLPGKIMSSQVLECIQVGRTGVEDKGNYQSTFDSGWGIYTAKWGI